MKKLLTIFFLLFACISACATNRYATSGDVASYNISTHGQLKLNDYIIDTATGMSGGLGQIFINNCGTSMSSLPAGGTIWFDATSLPDLYNVYLANGGTLWDNGSSADNPVKIRPLGGQIKITMTAASNTARMWLLADFEHVEINGYVAGFTGMVHNWTGPLHNSFGFVISGGTELNDNAFQLFVGGPSGLKTIDIKNVEIEHGFCGIRANVETAALTMQRFSVIGCYIHDSLEGEGAYLGKTSAAPYVEYEEMIIRDVVIARAAAEGLQLQHMISNATRVSLQENFVIWGPDGRWKHPFEPFQDNGAQWVADEGRNKMRNFIIDGGANTMLSILSGSTGTPTIEPAVIQNGLFNDGRDRGIYTASGLTNGVNWELIDLYFRAFNNTYPELTEAASNTHVISHNGTDKFSAKNITWDNSKTNLWEDATDIDDIIGTQQDNAMDAPAYNMPSFPDRLASQYSQWGEEYTVGVRTGDKIDYALDAIVANWVPGQEYKYYNCILAHTSSAATRPDLDATHWEEILWDEEGWPNYHANHDAGDTQTEYGWDDYRLTADSEWNLKGMGLRSNFRNTNTTTYQWYIDDNGDETGMQELSGEKKKEFEKSTELKGRYVRLKAFVKPVYPGAIIEQWVSDWVLVN